MYVQPVSMLVNIQMQQFAVYVDKKLVLQYSI